RSTVYGFYAADFKIVDRNALTAKDVPHEAWKCEMCGKNVYHNLMTKDKSSGHGLHLHAEKCFGIEAVKAAFESGDLKATRDMVKKAGKKRQGVLTGMLQVDNRATHQGRYRAECARWCSENFRPFNIVADRGFKKLMKTGCPGMYIPHLTTVSRDTKILFAKTRCRLAKKFKSLNSHVHIVLDGWTSPNHKAFIAYKAHWEEDGQCVSTVLDFYELPEV
ncbi:hypothetical protein BDZ89DRAFT_962394, partial [Hymenopellis radicata]